MIHPLWLYHILDWPMSATGGYPLTSGLGVGWMIGLGALARHKNCHHKGCWRIGHYHPDHGWPSCRRHYIHKLEVSPPAPPA
ncbi:MAG: hypothetical protein ACXVXP_00565 [Mycobacteriaceae bacterium]